LVHCLAPRLCEAVPDNDFPRLPVHAQRMAVPSIAARLRTGDIICENSHGAELIARPNSAGS
jgi:hypothetical protein